MRSLLKYSSGFWKNGSINKEILSAKKTFLINPIKNKSIPKRILSFLKIILFLSCGISSFALRIGPAINCGKKIINSAKFVNVSSSLNSLEVISTIKAMTVKVINEIANGNDP